MVTQSIELLNINNEGLPSNFFIDAQKKSEKGIKSKRIKISSVYVGDKMKERVKGQIRALYMLVTC